MAAGAPSIVTVRTLSASTSFSTTSRPAQIGGAKARDDERKSPAPRSDAHRPDAFRFIAPMLTDLAGLWRATNSTVGIDVRCGTTWPREVARGQKRACPNKDPAADRETRLEIRAPVHNLGPARNCGQCMQAERVRDPGRMRPHPALGAPATSSRSDAFSRTLQFRDGDRGCYIAHRRATELAPDQIQAQLTCTGRTGILTLVVTDNGQ